MTQSEKSPKSAIERALGVVTRVEAGEGPTALVLSLNVFVLMTAYSAIKPVREALILAMESGAEYKSYMNAVIAVALLFAVPAYARFADRVKKNWLVVSVTLFFASHLLLFWAGSVWAPLREHLGLVYYVWIGVFNMMVVAQFWAFANDLYRAEQGERLFPLLGVGQTVGAVAGSGVAVLVLKAVGVFQMLLVGGALLCVSAGLTELAYRLELRHHDLPKKHESEEKPDKSGAFALVLRSKYLRPVALFTVIFTFVNSNGEYMLGKLIKGAADARVAAGELGAEAVKDYIGAAYSRFYFFTNIATVVIQALIVSRLIRRFGFRGAFYVLPTIAMIDALGVSAFPVLAVLFVGKIAENGTDYSLNNTLRGLLWLPTTREMKYKAKQAIDTFFVRLGDVSSALLVFAFADRLGLGVRWFAVVNLALCACWLLLAKRITSEYRRLSTSTA